MGAHFERVPSNTSTHKLDAAVIPKIDAAKFVLPKTEKS
jgi:hypothetical protein